MATKKKTAKKTSAKPAKAASSLTIAELRDQALGTELDLTVRVTLTGSYGDSFEVEDSEGDNHAFAYDDVVSSQLVPKAKVKVSGEGAERAAQILRDKGFDVD